MRAKFIFLLSLLVLISTNFINAQKIVTGKVTDESGTTLPGVTVVAKGTTAATITDLDGNYKITVPDGAKELEFSMIGMQTVTMEIKSDIINVSMNTVEQEVGDVIVIGYGTQKKSDKTGAVSQIGNDDLDKGVITDPIQSLQGKISGVLITKKGGDPNAGFSVQIRGSAGLYSNTQPLYVVDGVPGVDPTTIAPEDIESFNVLKDASSAAIYGSRGANGVVIITTKGGKKDISSFEINSYVSIDQVAKRLNLLNGDEIRAFAQQIGDTGFVDNGANTDWQNQIYRTGITQSHNFAFSGGDAKTSYRASFTASDFTGVLKGTDKTRYIGRMNFRHTALNDHLVVTANMAGTLEDNDYISYSGWGYNSVIYQMIRRNPTDPVYDTTGNYFESNRIFQYANPLGIVNQVQNQRKYKYILANATAELTILKGLTAKINLDYNRSDATNYYFEPTYAFGGNSEGYGSISNSNNESKILETTLNYDNTFGKHSVNFVAGYSFQQDDYWGNSQQGKDPASNLLGLNNMSVFLNVNPGDISSYRGTNRLISFFGRLVYNFDSKYYLTATLRQDGSSKFGINNKWGLFPSGSLAWNIKRESFLSNVNLISDLKLRVGYGMAGNQEIGNYLNVISYGPAGNAPDPETGQTAISFEANHNANPDLKWETNKELNVGLDFGILQNKISGSFEYYNKITYNLIAEYSVPVPPNAVDRTYANVGSIGNTGFELNLQVFLFNKKQLQWKTLYTFSTNKQTVLSLSNDKYEWDLMKLSWAQGQGLVGSDNYTQVLGEGYNLGTFYLPVYAGINDDGEFLFKTESGGVTHDISKAQRQIVGSALPKFTMGWSNYFTIAKNIDLSFSFRVVYGYKVFNNTRLIFGNPSFLPNSNVLTTAVDEYNRGLRSAPEVSDYYLEDGSFGRLDNAVLGYTFDTKNSAWIKKVRIYISGSNLFTLTNYTGIDPEINYSGLSFGIDTFDVYPKTRSLTLGLNISF